MADTPRMLALRNLAGQLPVANSRIAQGQASARDLQLQQAVAVRPSGSAIQPAAQQAGAQQAQTAGQQMVERAQQGIQQAGQLGQLGAQEQGRENQAQLFTAQQGAREEQMTNEQRLAALSERGKKELYDAQLQFQKDENGRTQFNAIQLADYARTSAENQEQYKNYAQQAQQLEQRNLQAMQTAYDKINQDLDQQYQVAKQKGDQDTMTAIAAQKRDAQIAMQETQNQAANRSAAWGAGGAIVGGIAGAIFGGPAGASAGASAGGALGTFAGSRT